MLLLVAACASPPPDGSTPDPFHDDTPVITGLTWSCDVDTSKWTFTVDTTGWTGGGTLWMARDSQTWEQHTVHSTSAAADGSWDHLELDLAVVADWRDAQSGSSTRWQCADQDALGYLLAVKTPDASQVADCRRWGADDSVWAAIAGVPTCDTVLADTGQ